MSEHSNQEINEDVLVIDEADDLQEELINSSTVNNIHTARVDHERIMVCKASLLNMR